MPEALIPTQGARATHRATGAEVDQAATGAEADQAATGADVDLAPSRGLLRRLFFVEIHHRPHVKGR